MPERSCTNTMDIGHLYNAGHCANEAVALGLISPATLMVASRIESAGFRRPEDNKFPEQSTERFERLTDLWETLDARKAEMAEEKSKRDAKVSKDPLSYFCAADDCGDRGDEETHSAEMFGMVSPGVQTPLLFKRLPEGGAFSFSCPRNGTHCLVGLETS